jgi:acetolactate synthase I/II/III large subunit
MNGAETLVQTLLENGVDTCFANPGTSEMHFVAALDGNPDMRCILCLFEGGTTGAADGYARMTGNVAATLLHLAPGFGNAFANLHNARKAGSGMVNIVGDHASYHLKYESPLKGDVEGVSTAVSHWTRTCQNARSVALDGAAAIAAARSGGGQIATLILPADTAWEPGGEVAMSAPVRELRLPGADRIAAAAEVLRTPSACLMVGREALHGRLRRIAGQIAQETGCRLMSDTAVPRLERGGGSVRIEPLVYHIDGKLGQLEQAQHIVLCGLHRPVAFFAYPGKPSLPEPASCQVHSLCDPDMDIAGTLNALAQVLNISADAPVDVVPLELPALPKGVVTLDKAGAAIAALMPENSIIVNESVTASFPLLSATRTARPHDLLATTGGAIGQCLPCATGAAVACPDRQVIALTGDGSAMYTLQSLWTMAREQLNVVVIVIANRGYQILHGELKAVGVDSAGRNAHRMFDLVDPDLDWVALARGHGVAGTRANSMEAFNNALARGLDTNGPYLIELVVPAG